MTISMVIVGAFFAVFFYEYDGFFLSKGEWFHGGKDRARSA
jgi:hypothetical protein